MGPWPFMYWPALSLGPEPESPKTEDSKRPRVQTSLNSRNPKSLNRSPKPTFHITRSFACSKKSVLVDCTMPRPFEMQSRRSSKPKSPKDFKRPQRPQPKATSWNAARSILFLPTRKRCIVCASRCQVANTVNICKPIEDALI